MLRKPLIALLTFMALWWSSVQAVAQTTNSEANRLFVEANTTFMSSKNLSTSDRDEALLRVRLLLDQIVSEYPESKPAQAMAKGNAGAIVLNDLPASNEVIHPPSIEKSVAAASSKLDELEDASALSKLEHSVEILDILLVAKDLEEARILAGHILALPKWEKVLAPQTVKKVRDTASNADVTSKAALVCLVGTYVLDAVIDQYVEPFVRAKLSSGFDSYLVSFLHETVDGACAAGPALLAGSAGAGGLLYPIAKAVEVLNELDSLNRSNTDLVDQAVEFAKLQIAALESVTTYNFQDLFDYKIAQDAVATDLMTGSGLNVGAGRRLLIVNAVMLIKARQIEGKEVNAELELLGQQVSEFDGTPENLWYRWAKTVNLGRDGLRDYAGFAAGVFEDLEVLRESGGVVVSDAKSGEQISEWGPEILEGVADIRTEYRPCSGASDPAACFKSKGVSDIATAFIMAVHDDPSNFASFPFEFRETGKIDVAHLEWQGASTSTWPILLNGTPKQMTISGTRNLAAIFTDPTSRKMLAKYPKATVYSGAIRSHRLLGDGTQRFVHVELITDGCRACKVLGSAVTFLDIGPSTGGALRTTPAGLFLDERFAQVDVSRGMPLQRFPTAAELRSNPASLQTALNFLGYNAEEMDGYPGPQTRNALMAFQVEHCLPATGQPDSASTNALLSTNGFETPCSGQRLPTGVSANSPLISGKYVKDLAQCKLEQTPWELLWEQVLVDGTNFILGHENPCTTRRTDIRDGITLFRGSCSLADDTREASWRLDVRSNSEFEFISQKNTFGILDAATYGLCDDQASSGEAGSDEYSQNVTSSAVGSENYSAPDGYHWAQLASRRTGQEARAFATDMGDEVRIFRTSNGWHAITGALLFESESLPDMIADQGWPSDSLLTRGESFVEELPLDPAGPAPTPAFTHTQTLRATDVLWFAWDGEGRTIYDTRALKQGEDVVVWGGPDEEGYCRGGGGEGAVLKCTDIVAFAHGSETLAKASAHSLSKTDNNDGQSEVAIPKSDQENGFFEPERGTELRAAILDAARPLAIEAYGDPIEFFVETLRVSSGVAYANLYAQRPGGKQIAIETTPAYRRGEVDLLSGDPDNISTILALVNGSWVVTRSVLASSEAWWLDDCEGLSGVLPETCPARNTASENITSQLESSVEPVQCRSGYIETRPQKCKACVRRPEEWFRYMQKTKNISAHWSGACDGGYISGTGYITWYSGKDVVWKTVLNNRYLAVSGVPRFALRSGDVQIRYGMNLASGFGYGKECIAIKDYVHDISPILIIVDSRLPLSNRNILNEVTEEAERLVMRDCEVQRKRFGIRKEVSRFSAYTINLISSDHPRVASYITADRPIPGVNITKVKGISGCGFRPTVSKISECFGQNESVSLILEDVKSSNQARQIKERAAEKQREQRAAQAVAQQKQSKLDEMKRQIDQRWASHMNDMFSGKYVIENVGDLIQYNKAKAIALLSKGVTLQLNTKNMSFQDGTVVITDEHDPTDIYRPVREAELASMREMDRFLRQTQTVGTDFSGPSIDVICRLDASALERLDGKTSVPLEAEMQALNARSAVFECKLK